MLFILVLQPWELQPVVQELFSVSRFVELTCAKCSVEAQIICSVYVQQARNAWGRLNVLQAVIGCVLQGCFMCVHPGVSRAARRASLSACTHTCLSKKAGCKHGRLGKSLIARGSACFIYGIEETKCFVGLRRLFVNTWHCFWLWGLYCLYAIYLSLVAKELDFSSNPLNNCVSRIIELCLHFLS